MTGASIAPWLPVLALAALLVVVFLVLGYGLIGLAFLFVLAAMGGGAFLYWKDGGIE